MIEKFISDLNKEHNLPNGWSDSVFITQKHCEILLGYTIEQLEIIKIKLINLSLEVATKSNQYKIAFNQYQEIVGIIQDKEDIKHLLSERLQKHIFEDMPLANNVVWPNCIDNNRIHSFLSSISALDLINFMNSKESSIHHENQIFYRDEIECVLKRSLTKEKLDNLFKLYLYKGNGYWRPCFYINDEVSVSTYENFETLYNAIIAYENLTSYLINNKKEHEQYLSNQELETLYENYFYHMKQLEVILEKDSFGKRSRRQEEDYELIKKYLSQYKLQNILEKKLKENNNVLATIKI